MPLGQPPASHRSVAGGEAPPFAGRSRVAYTPGPFEALCLTAIMIKVENLRKSFGSNVAVNDVSFEVAPGEVLGFLGPNGAGKSTTMRIITGFISADAGRASVCGFDVDEQPIEAKRRIGYLPEAA